VLASDGIAACVGVVVVVWVAGALYNAVRSPHRALAPSDRPRRQPGLRVGDDGLIALRVSSRRLLACGPTMTDSRIELNPSVECAGFGKGPGHLQMTGLMPLGSLPIESLLVVADLLGEVKDDLGDVGPHCEPRVIARVPLGVRRIFLAPSLACPDDAGHGPATITNRSAQVRPVDLITTALRELAEESPPRLVVATAEVGVLDRVDARVGRNYH
jgi:hypothetical protein